MAIKQKQSGSASLQSLLTSSLFDGPWQVDHLMVNVRGTTQFETNIIAGAWNSETSEVLVDGSLQPWEQFETFVHEMKHAFDAARQVHQGTPATEAIPTRVPALACFM